MTSADDIGSDFVTAMCDLGQSIKDLALTQLEARKRRERVAARRTAESARRTSVVPDEMRRSSTSSSLLRDAAAESFVTAHSEVEEATDWSEAVQHLNVMLSSWNRGVRLQASSTLAVLADSSAQVRDAPPAHHCSSSPLSSPCPHDPNIIPLAHRPRRRSARWVRLCPSSSP